MTKRKSQSKPKLSKQMASLSMTPGVRVVGPRKSKAISSVKGTGGYFGDIGEELGRTAGSYFGRKAGDALGTITGFGDYTVTSNALLKSGMRMASGTPQFKVNKGITTITHREFVTSVLAPSTPSLFTPSRYVVNSGSTTTFPWLAPIASRYQKYRFKGLVFSFESRSSEYSSASSLGNVMIASNYNAYDSPFSSELAMQNSAFAVTCKPSESMLHPVECKPDDQAQKWYYTRDDVNAVNAVQLYDMCNVTVATSGLSAAAGTQLGQLWATYIVELDEPILPTTSTVSAGSSWYVQYTSASQQFSAGPFMDWSNLRLAVLNGTTSQLAGPITVPLNQVLVPASGPMNVLPNTGPSNIVAYSTTNAASSLTAGGRNTLYFNRPGVYQIAAWYSSGSLVDPLFVIGASTGASIVKSVCNTNANSTYTLWTITISATPFSVIGALLPSINFDQNTTGTTGGLMSVAFSILS